LALRHLPDYVRKGRKTASKTVLPDGRPVISLSETEKSHILRVYNETGGNKMKTARLLGIGLNTLRRKLTSYGIS
jgi:transcriptional regulator of acetoin/glycerol metabolism